MVKVSININRSFALGRHRRRRGRGLLTHSEPKKTEDDETKSEVLHGPESYSRPAMLSNEAISECCPSRQVPVRFRPFFIRSRAGTCEYGFQIKWTSAWGLAYAEGTLSTPSRQNY